MKRRSFFGLVAGLPVIAVAPVDIPEYDYEWNQSRESTDPRMPVLGYGDSAPHVYLNGDLMNHSGLKITRCQSGVHGWIEYMQCEPRGTPIIRDGELVRALLHGRVEVMPLA